MLSLLHIETVMVSAMGISITRTKTKVVGIAGPQKTIRSLCRYIKTAVIVCTPGDNGRCILLKELYRGKGMGGGGGGSVFASFFG